MRYQFCKLILQTSQSLLDRIRNLYCSAPQGGLYFFTISAVSDSDNKNLFIDVIKNGKKQFDIDDRSEVDMTNVSYQWMLRLNRGDSVKLRVIVGKLYVDEIDQVHFTG